MAFQIAVIGAGYWGKNLVRNFHALGVLGMVVERRVGNEGLYNVDNKQAAGW